MFQNKTIWRTCQALLLSLMIAVPSADAVIRDGGVDPANLGKGGWLFIMEHATNGLGQNVSCVTNEHSLFAYMKSQGMNFVIVKAGTAGTLWNGTYSTPQFTSNLVQAAHDNGLLIFGSNRSYGEDIPGEIEVADHVFREGADGFIWDAESEWESNRPWITNGPLQAWTLCSSVRARHPSKFLAHNPIDIISVHSSFPFKEFGYWSDCVMPQVYHHAATLGSASAAVNWADVNWKKFHADLSKMAPSVINGETVYWTNAIKPLLYMREAYGANQTDAPAIPPNDLTEFMDYLLADPHCPNPEGFKGADFFRAELYDVNQWANLKASTIGDFSGIVNNIVLDDDKAQFFGDWVLVKTIACTLSSPGFYGETGSDRNSFGTNYWKRNQGSGTAYAQFTPTVVTSGDYDLYQWHPLRTEASTNVPFQITYNGGSTTVYANQQTNAGSWSWLGRFNFAAGNSGCIRVLDTFAETNGLALVDGLKLVFVPPFAVPDAPSSLTATGVTTWQIDLCWQDNSTNETGFVIAEATSPGGPYTNLAVLSANSTNYSVVGLNAGSTYYYTVSATNYLGLSEGSNEAFASTVTGTNYPPAISTIPSDCTTDAGSNATFFVTAEGTPPIFYQWRQNNADIPGAISPALLITNAQPTNAGAYTVFISNAYGSITSAPALLTIVTHPPGITTQPQSQTALAGSRVEFSAAANGTAPLFYQWRFNGTNLSGATRSSYSISNIRPDHAGTYTLLVTNLYGIAASSGALLTVHVPPAVVLQPESQWVTAGDTFTFSVTASGTTPLAYQWQQSGTNIAGATDSIFSKAFATENDAGEYMVRVDNIAGTITSSNATLTVTAQPVAPTIVLQPQDQIVVAGEPVTLSVRAAGTTPIYYQWLFNDSVLSGATHRDLTFEATSLEQSGIYSVVVSNAFGSATSSNVMLTVNAKFQVGGMTQMWALPGGSRSYLTTASQNERGMAYNPKSNRVLVVSRSGSTRVYALDGDTGQELHQLSMSGVSGGYYTLSLIRAADDGAVYAANLTLSGAGTPFKLYRWANDDASTTATVAYSGNPSPLDDQRWGDSMEIRGAGTNTQILVGSRSGTNFVLFTTTNGRTFTPRAIDVPNMAPGNLGLGLAFGHGDTFWAKSGSMPMLQVAFDLTTRTAAIVRSYTNFFPTVTPIAVNPLLNLMAGVAIETPDNLKLFDMSSSNAAPRLIATNAFASNNGNSYVTGAADFGRDRVYALDSNNGLLAMRLTATSNSTPFIVEQPSSSTILVDQPFRMEVLTMGTPPLYFQWRYNDLEILNGTNAVFSVTNAETIYAGTYSVVVSNAFGCVTSAPATITVLTPSPAITSQPKNLTVTVGMPARFSVTAAGPRIFSYQWRSNGIDIPGATAGTYCIASAQHSDAATYSVLIANPYGETLSSNATLTVRTPQNSMADDFDPGIDLSQWYEFGGTVLSTNAGGSVSPPRALVFTGEPLRFATTWPLDTTQGGLIQFYLRFGGAMNPNIWHVLRLPQEAVTLEYSTNHGVTWTELARYDTDVYRDWALAAVMIPAEAQTPHTQFRWEQPVTSQAATGQWALDDVSITAGPAAPVITMHPQHQPAMPGRTASFNVIAAGTPPLFYQWKCNGIDLPGETNAALIVNGPSTNSQTSYSVVVSNNLGTVLSSNAILRVLEPVTSMADDFDPAIDESQWWSFGARVAATNLAGYISPSNSLWFSGFGSRHAISRPIDTRAGGTLRFQLRTGSNTSQGSTNWNWWDTAPNAILVECSTDAGTNWAQMARYAPELLTNWTSLSLVIDTIAQSPETLFRWRQLTNIFGSIANHWALDDVSIQTFTNPTPPFVVSPPRTGAVESGSTTNLQAVINGSAPLYFQWWFSNALGSYALPGATNWNHALLNLETNQTGLYWLAATNAYGATSTVPALLTVVPAIPLGDALDTVGLDWQTGGNGFWKGQTNVTQDQIDAAETTSIGDSQQAWLRTDVTGPAILKFWWKVSSETDYDFLNFYVGTNMQTRISGEVAWAIKTFTLPAGTHTLTWVYSKDGSVSSRQDKAWLDQVTLTQVTPPNITSQPESQTVSLGSTAKLRVTASSPASMTYKWFFSGTNIVGATASTLTLTNVQYTNAGAYSVVVSNIAGVVTSSNAFLTVISPLLFGANADRINLDWSGPCVLQSATNVAGPYSDETNTARPFQITPTGEQRFFRLRMSPTNFPEIN